MAFNLTWKASWNIQSANNATKDYVRDYSRKVAVRIRDRARANVRPGGGPGPHPHRTDHGWTWIDTGNLAAAITLTTEGVWVGNKLKLGVTVDTAKAPYAVPLEMGWITVGGKRARYPFLQPAVNSVIAGLRSQKIDFSGITRGKLSTSGGG